MASKQSNQVPYRTNQSPPIGPEVRKRRLKVLGGLGVGLAGVLAFMIWQRDPAPEPSRINLTWSEQIASFPPEAASETAVSLDPLLLANAPENPALSQPRPGSVNRVRRGNSISFRFNHPMVVRSLINRPLEVAPISVVTREGRAVPGAYLWTQRNELRFTPESAAWDRSMEAAVNMSTLQSLSGEPVVEQEPVTFVFDGTPMVVSGGMQRVAEGDPLPLYFDNPVTSADLSGEVLAYEIGGGARSVPFTIQRSGWEDRGYRRLFRMNVRPLRSLEPGTDIGVALTPRWWSWTNGSPGTVRFQLQPRPRIEGILCPPHSNYASGCQFQSAPARVIELGHEQTLRLLASETLSRTPPSVSVVPNLPGLEVTVENRTVSITGDWEAERNYTLRVTGLQTESAANLQALPPLAIRSSGLSPQVATAENAFSVFETDARAELHLVGTNIASGSARLIAIENLADTLNLHELDEEPEQREVRELSLSSVIPDARANRAGRGTLPLLDTPVQAVGLRASSAGAFSWRLVQRTDLAISANALSNGVAATVTRLSSGQPVSGAEFTFVSRGPNGITSPITATSDASGYAFVEVENLALQNNYALEARLSGERAILLSSPSTGVGPARAGVFTGSAMEESVVARVFTDRDLYRPGTTLRMGALLRERNDDGVLTAAASESLRFRVMRSGTPLGESRVFTDRYGFVHAEEEIPTSAELGDYTIELARIIEPPVREGLIKDVPGVPRSTEVEEEILATHQIRVGEFETPSLRVDLSASAQTALSDQSISVDLEGAFLFGAPAADSPVEWLSLVQGAVPSPRDFSRYTFGPDEGCVALSAQQGALTTNSDGDASFTLQPIATCRRTRVALEATLSASSGERATDRVMLEITPSEIEVGIRQGERWVRFSEASRDGIRIDAAALDLEREAAAGVDLTARFVQEGWRQWYERRNHAQLREFQARRAQRETVAHECALVTDDEGKASCSFVPTEPGAYRLEVTGVDGAGRESTTSRRVYLAGPDESPDRDPIGAPVTVTPNRDRFVVGETAEIAFEAPWDGRAILTVFADGVVHREVREVQSGGNVMSFEVTDEMTPNVFASLDLVRPRTGVLAPNTMAESVDLDAPDERFGVVELRATPADASLDIALNVPQVMNAGDEVEVSAVVSQGGEPADAGVTLFAVDEGLLRLSDYELSDFQEAMSGRRGADFVFEAIRRGLVTRVTPTEWRRGGDGTEMDAATQTLRPTEDYPDPTPLWAPGLETDNGEVSVSFTLPMRGTTYRVMALAMNESYATGTASAELRAEEDVLIRPIAPRFLTEGDEAMIRFEVHAVGRDVSEPLLVTIGQSEERHDVNLTEGTSTVVDVLVTAPAVADTRELSLGAAIGGASKNLMIPLAPRAAWNTAEASGLVRGELGSDDNQPTTLNLAPGSQGRIIVELSSHPLAGMVRTLRREVLGEGGTPARAANALAVISALMTLDHLDAQLPGDNIGDADATELATLQRLVDETQRTLRQASDSATMLLTDSTNALLLAAELNERRELALEFDEWHEAALSQLRSNLDRDWLDARARANLLLVLNRLQKRFDFEVEEVPSDMLVEIADSLFENRASYDFTTLATLAMVLGEVEGADADSLRTLQNELTRYLTEDNREDMSIAPQLRYHPRSPGQLGRILEALATLPDFGVGRLEGEVGSSEGEKADGVTDSASIAAALLSETQREDGDEQPSFFAQLQRANAEQWINLYSAATVGLVRQAELFGALDSELTLDGQTLEPVQETASSARYLIDVGDLEFGEARPALAVPNAKSGVFLRFESNVTVPIDADAPATGDAIAVHRRFETLEGLPVESGDSLEVGTELRVRLYVYAGDRYEGSPIELVDPMLAGLVPEERQLQMEPRSALFAILGQDPNESFVDPRGHLANRSLYYIRDRQMERNTVNFELGAIPNHELTEFTYLLRAAHVGTFSAPPAEAVTARETARSESFAIEVVPMGEVSTVASRRREEIAARDARRAAAEVEQAEQAEQLAAHEAEQEEAMEEELQEMRIEVPGGSEE